MNAEFMRAKGSSPLGLCILLRQVVRSESSFFTRGWRRWRKNIGTIKITVKDRSLSKQEDTTKHSSDGKKSNR